MSKPTNVEGLPHGTHPVKPDEVYYYNLQTGEQSEEPFEGANLKAYIYQPKHPSDYYFVQTFPGGVQSPPFMVHIEKQYTMNVNANSDGTFNEVQAYK